VEHRLPITPGFRMYKQLARSFNLVIIDKVKEEVDRLLQAKFIRPCRYADWVSNIVLVEKKNTGMVRICIDFRNLNRATPKDEYPMTIADILINHASSNKIIGFLDGNAGYNQIFMAKEDISKTAFRCPGFVGLFEWVVMTFGQKNVGATYQRVMNLTFHNLLGVIMEVCIDDLVVKSDGLDDHMANLKLAFKRMRKYGLCMNPLKCVFGVMAGRFLGFIVHEKGIQVEPKKVESIKKIEESVCKRDVQKLLRKINYLRMFISNMAGRVEPFLPLVRLNHNDEFTWGTEQKQAFEKIKECLTNPSVLRAPRVGDLFKLYVATQADTIGTVLTQEDGGKEFTVAYASRQLLDTETKYAYIERLCLSLYYVCMKFHHYILSSVCTVVCHHVVLKYMLHIPILGGRVGTWAYSLVEYD
jgi:hypothetical protein